MSSKSSISASDMYPVGMTAPFELVSELQRLLGKVSFVRDAIPKPLPRYAIQGVPEIAFEHSA